MFSSQTEDYPKLNWDTSFFVYTFDIKKRKTVQTLIY